MVKIWPIKKFFAAKLTEQQERHEKYSDSAHKLEPNIKESPGGLRDIQMIGWVLLRHFDTIDIKTLVKKRFLTRDEFNLLMTGRKFLWQIRFALHMLNDRREDRLLFEYQRGVAELLGFKSDDNSGIEEFMKLFFITIRDISRLNDMLLQHFEELILYKKRRDKIVPVNTRFQIRNNYIEVINNEIFATHPFALLELFLIMQQHPKIKGVRASTIRAIRNHLHLINNRFRNDIRHRSLFMEIIRQPNLVGHKLRMMHRYGVLAAYLPSFGKIEGLMQFDMYHIYTVDEHTLTVIKNMRRFALDEAQKKFPLCHEIVTKRLPKLELLYLAGLFHDIAKGRGGDHSSLGARDAIDFCKQHTLSDYDATLVGWLVENHLLMSKTAQREDIDDPEIIANFTKAVRDEIYLNYLLALTVADICATNPELWNSWKGTLLSSLYHRSLREIRRGKQKPILPSTRAKEIKHEALMELESMGLLESNIETLWKTFTQEYFLRHSTEEIVWHTEGIIKHKDKDKPLIMVKKQSARGGSLIFVYMKNRDYIFAETTKTIDQLGLNVLDAKITTNKKDFTLDTYVVLQNDNEMLSGKERLLEVKQRIVAALQDSNRPPNFSNWISNRQLNSFNIPTQINFSQDEKNKRTLMEVITIDRPGVLSRIGTAMAHCGVVLLGAKIATLGERAEDIFYIRDKNNEPITDESKFECLKKSISDSLSV
ncbi:MAG: [protein-PII] uridylyltransferase [Pseudomonadota bacterium]